MKDKKPKMSRKERERLMIEEMEAALWEQKSAEEKQAQTSEPINGGNQSGLRTGKRATKPTAQKGVSAGAKMHCSRCQTLMENGKCPNCGHYVYVPMDKEKRGTIRWIVGGICMVGFVILFVMLQSKK